MCFEMERDSYYNRHWTVDQCETKKSQKDASRKWAMRSYVRCEWKGKVSLPPSLSFSRLPSKVSLTFLSSQMSTLSPTWALRSEWKVKVKEWEKETVTKRFRCFEKKHHFLIVVVFGNWAKKMSPKSLFAWWGLASCDLESWHIQTCVRLIEINKKCHTNHSKEEAKKATWLTWERVKLQTRLKTQTNPQALSSSPCPSISVFLSLSPSLSPPPVWNVYFIPHCFLLSGRRTRKHKNFVWFDKNENINYNTNRQREVTPGIIQRSKKKKKKKAKNVSKSTRAHQRLGLRQ